MNELPRTLRPVEYKGHIVQALANGDGTFRYSIDGKEFEAGQKTALRARGLAEVRIDSKGFQDEDNTEGDE